jgi:hypothetical protein
MAQVWRQQFAKYHDTVFDERINRRRPINIGAYLLSACWQFGEHPKQTTLVPTVLAFGLCPIDTHRRNHRFARHDDRESPLPGYSRRTHLQRHALQLDPQSLTPPPDMLLFRQ